MTWICKATRWDHYLHVFDPKIHWLSLVNSFAFAGILCAMVSMIIWRNIARDVSLLWLKGAYSHPPRSQISRYNAMDLSVGAVPDYRERVP
jgi:hypothetical protein